MKLLTKSKYLAGLESHAYLWTLVNNPERIPEHDLATKDRFEDGHAVGEFAKKLFLEGIDLNNLEFLDNIEKTKELVKEKKTIFEAGFIHDKCFARIDVLIPNEEGFDLIEVKSSSSVKKEHIHDLSFQKYVLEKNGLIVKNCYVIHLNKEYVKKGKLNVEELFVKTKVTSEVNNIENVDLNVKEMLNVINLQEGPSFNIEDIPKSKHGNLFIDEFFNELPEGNVFELYNIRKKKAIQLYQEGITSIKELPGNTKLNHKQEIQVKAQDEVFINENNLKKFIEELEKPVIHLDFESFSLAIPEYDNTRPHQHLPFQYSMHIENEEVKHKEFLYEKGDDPRKSFIENLIKDLPTKGTILVFHQGYEIPRLKEIARDFPEYQEEISKIITRIKDLKDPFSNFWYHNKKQKGSNSIKEVLPIFSDKTHKGLVVSNGSEAMIIYKKNRGELSEELKKDLLDYCELDTEAMVIILKGLREVIKE